MCAARAHPPIGCTMCKALLYQRHKARAHAQSKATSSYKPLLHTYSSCQEAQVQKAHGSVKEQEHQPVQDHHREQARNVQSNNKALPDLGLIVLPQWKFEPILLQCPIPAARQRQGWHETFLFEGNLVSCVLVCCGAAIW